MRASLPSNAPLTGLRITSAGGDVAVRDSAGVREATTGQLLLDFEVQVAAGAVVLVADRALPPMQVSKDWFSVGEALEATDVVKAEEAYRRALADDPARLKALVNLGALLCEGERCFEAVTLFDVAVASGTVNALLHFNHAMALEDVGKYDRAMDSYRAALALEPAMSDAHYNLALLLERQGDGKGALRHFSVYRRLGEA